jgi:hypothetical protein
VRSISNQDVIGNPSFKKYPISLKQILDNANEII